MPEQLDTQNQKIWLVIPVAVEAVNLMGRCICGLCSKNRDAVCVCGLSYSSIGIRACPACGRPPWCLS